MDIDDAVLPASNFYDMGSTLVRACLEDALIDAGSAVVDLGRVDSSGSPAPRSPATALGGDVSTAALARRSPALPAPPSVASKAPGGVHLKAAGLVCGTEGSGLPVAREPGEPHPEPGVAPSRQLPAAPLPPAGPPLRQRRPAPLQAPFSVPATFTPGAAPSSSRPPLSAPIPSAAITPRGPAAQSPAPSSPDRPRMIPEALDELTVPALRHVATPAASATPNAYGTREVLQNALDVRLRLKPSVAPATVQTSQHRPREYVRLPAIHNRGGAADAVSAALLLELTPPPVRRRMPTPPQQPNTKRPVPLFLRMKMEFAAQEQRVLDEARDKRLAEMLVVFATPAPRALYRMGRPRQRRQTGAAGKRGAKVRRNRRLKHPEELLRPASSDAAQARDAAAADITTRSLAAPHEEAESAPQRQKGKHKAQKNVKRRRVLKGKKSSDASQASPAAEPETS